MKQSAKDLSEAPELFLYYSSLETSKVTFQFVVGIFRFSEEAFQFALKLPCKCTFGRTFWIIWSHLDA